MKKPVEVFKPLSELFEIRVKKDCPLKKTCIRWVTQVLSFRSYGFEI
jgi:hypothetical protein